MVCGPELVFAFCGRGNGGRVQTPLLPLLPEAVALEQGAGSLGGASFSGTGACDSRAHGASALCLAWLPWVTASAVGAPGPRGQFLGVKFHGLSSLGPQPSSRRRLPLRGVFE